MYLFLEFGTVLHAISLQKVNFGNNTDTVERWFNKWCTDEVRQIKAERPVKNWNSVQARKEPTTNTAIAANVVEASSGYQMPDDDRQYAVVEVQSNATCMTHLSKVAPSKGSTVYTKLAIATGLN